MAAFKGVISETVILSFLSSLIFATHRYLKERLALVWREKLTRKLHRQYFHAMNYYKISHLNESKIADVEERITRQMRMHVHDCRPRPTASPTTRLHTRMHMCTPARLRARASA